ncbi:MAG: UDP-N-acetylglucosamine pyrophosphorylase [Oscillospiraceae bacterium]|jgi:NDP-sugar pyrophosphorylase family protein|nr:UDP-N-acetylglucosamine pyrophosphorylase [Oscillospiraceae bacterium]
MQKSLKTTQLLDLSETISSEIFSEKVYPWQVLSDLSLFIVSLGRKLPQEKYIFFKENIWVAKNAKISETASICGPAIIDEESEIRHSAFIRPNVIIGKNVVVGNSTEVKNSILFNKVQVPHYNYVGDSILGFKSHLGAGVILSNIKSDKTKIMVRGEKAIDTNLQKLGSIIGDFVEIGCNSVLNPGTIIGKNSVIYPLCSVRGVIGEDCIFKSESCIVKKQNYSG